MSFPASVIPNITNQSGHLTYQLISEKNQIHTGNLTHCKQTLQLIQFYLVKIMRGNRKISWHNSSFPSSPFNTQDLSNNSPYCLPYSSCGVIVLRWWWWYFLYSRHLSAWYCIDILQRNSVLVTHGS